MEIIRLLWIFSIPSSRHSINIQNIIKSTKDANSVQTYQSIPYEIDKACHRTYTLPCCHCVVCVWVERENEENTYRIFVMKVNGVLILSAASAMDHDFEASWNCAHRLYDILCGYRWHCVASHRADDDAGLSGFGMAMDWVVLDWIRFRCFFWIEKAWMDECPMIDQWLQSALETRGWSRLKKGFLK